MIYLDHAATTPCDKRVADKMLPYLGEVFSNPSALYQGARRAKRAIEESRRTVSDFLNCSSEEIIFTNGGTESDNLAILGRARSLGSGHIITTQIEHHAVLNTCRQLEKEGFQVTYLPVASNGLVRLGDVERAIKPDTILVSVMYANNEIGTVQPIARIGRMIKAARERGGKIIFHTDACQAAGYLEMSVDKLGVDLLTFNGSKIYGPKGIGALYVRSGVQLSPILFGGAQEGGLRPGTENVPAIVGLGAAVALLSKYSSEEEKKLRDYLIEKLLRIPGAKLNGCRARRLPNNVNISFAGVEGEAAVLYLDKEGIACATGSACTSHSLEPSHVVSALEKGDAGRARAHSSLRLTIGRSTSRGEINEAIARTAEVVEKLREMSAKNLPPRGSCG